MKHENDDDTTDDLAVDSASPSPKTDQPFRVIVPERSAGSDSDQQDSVDASTSGENDETWHEDDIQAAYLKAMETLEAVESDFADRKQALREKKGGGTPAESVPSNEETDPAVDNSPEAEDDSELPRLHQPDDTVGKASPQAETDEDAEAVSQVDELPGSPLEEVATATDEDEVGSLNDFFALTAPAPQSVVVDLQELEDDDEAPQPPQQSSRDVATPVRMQPAQILEAALFVGGEPLTIKRLSTLLGDEFEREFIEQTLQELNLRYVEQRRPYEIQLTEGGWQMRLRYEYEPVRHRVFGQGPKEIRLSREAIEVLSLVAYRQPISKANVEQLAPGKPGGVLGQLVRRELIEIERPPDQPKQVVYRTTSRFLQVFGLGSLEELPQAEDLTFK